MKPVTVVALSFVLATAGTWARTKRVSKKQIVGGAFVAIAIAILEESEPEIAKQFSWLILATVAGAYGEDVFTSIGNIVQPDKPPQTRGGPTPRTA